MEVRRETIAQLDNIVNALENLGGKAHYSDIYCEYERITQTALSEGQKAGIRKRIEDNSSDSQNFTGKSDIFYSVHGIGGGFWGLR